MAADDWYSVKDSNPHLHPFPPGYSYDDHIHDLSLQYVTVAPSWSDKPNWHLPVSRQDSGLILGLRTANERRHNKVTLSLIGWVQSRKT